MTSDLGKKGMRCEGGGEREERGRQRERGRGETVRQGQEVGERGRR